jgi:hypothetical protein
MGMTLIHLITILIVLVSQKRAKLTLKCKYNYFQDNAHEINNAAATARARSNMLAANTSPLKKGNQNLSMSTIKIFSL